MNGCEIIYYSTPEEEDFTLDIADFISKLSEDIDIIFISNPNGTTSQIIDAESLEFIAKICDGNNITMVVDEEYMDFVDDLERNSAIPLTSEYENVIVLRNTTKFFAVPGLRLAYMITSNPVLKKTLEITGLPFAIGKLVEAAGVAMFTDEKYIAESRELIRTERNLVYSALSTHKSIKLYKPAANFILIRILRDAIFGVINCGCRLLATAHGYSMDDVRDRAGIRRLVENRVFERYVVLGGDKAGQISDIFDGQGNRLCWYD